MHFYATLADSVLVCFFCMVCDLGLDSASSGSDLHGCWHWQQHPRWVLLSLSASESDSQWEFCFPSLSLWVWTELSCPQDKPLHLWWQVWLAFVAQTQKEKGGNFIHCNNCMKRFFVLNETQGPVEYFVEFQYLCHVCVCVCACARACVCVYAHAHMCVCMHAHVCVYSKWIPSNDQCPVAAFL